MGRVHVRDGRRHHQRNHEPDEDAVPDVGELSRNQTGDESRDEPLHRGTDDDTGDLPGDLGRRDQRRQAVEEPEHGPGEQAEKGSIEGG